jgi:pentapeptide repeat protein
MDEERHSKILDLDKVKDNKDYNIKARKVLRNFKADSELWDFLAKNNKILDNINDWNIYRRATEIGIEPSIKPKDINEVLDLLKNGNIVDFNKKRRNKEFSDLNLENADLENADLLGANLEGAKLMDANLRNANLRDAYLMDANLRNAKLTDSTLEGSYLIGSNLEGAYLIGSSFDGANLENAKLLNSIIIIGNKTYNKLILDTYTRFDNAIIDDHAFIEYIGKHTKNLPQEIQNKKELKEKLQKYAIPDNLVLHYLT